MDFMFWKGVYFNIYCRYYKSKIDKFCIFSLILLSRYESMSYLNVFGRHFSRGLEEIIWTHFFFAYGNFWVSTFLWRQNIFLCSLKLSNHWAILGWLRFLKGHNRGILELCGYKLPIWGMSLGYESLWWYFYYGLHNFDVICLRWHHA